MYKIVLLTLLRHATPVANELKAEVYNGQEYSNNM